MEGPVIVSAGRMRLLLVEDDKKAARVLLRGLHEEGFVVDVAHSGDVGAEMATGTRYDLILLDWLLPRKDGISLCRDLRKHGSATPVLMLTARDALGDRVLGLDSGADDYLTKPFAFDELLARLRALIRRGQRPLLPERLRIAGLELDTRAQRVFKRHRPVTLTTREYALLEYLARRMGEVVSRAEIAEHVWDEKYEPFSNVIDVYVRRLRRKLDDPGSESLIHTRRGAGYELVRTGKDGS